MDEKFFRKGPINAAKNKPHLPTEAEIEDVSNADERKTVVLDEDLEGVSLEDRVWLYWKRNSTFIVFTVVAAFAIVIGVQGWKMYKANSSASIASAYSAATTPAELATFAKAYSGTKLAGVAALENADAAYKAAKYADAIALYKEAEANLGKTILSGRAQIGEAMSQILGGEAAKGEELLGKIYATSSYPNYKAQAGYLLALTKIQSGKTEDAKKILKEIADNANNGTFAVLANQELSNLK